MNIKRIRPGACAPGMEEAFFILVVSWFWLCNSSVVLDITRKTCVVVGECWYWFFSIIIEKYSYWVIFLKIILLKKLLLSVKSDVTIVTIRHISSPCLGLHRKFNKDLMFIFIFQYCTLVKDGMKLCLLLLYCLLDFILASFRSTKVMIAMEFRKIGMVRKQMQQNERWVC